MERLLDVAELQPQDWPRRASCTVSSVMYTLYNTTLGERQMCVWFVWLPAAWEALPSAGCGHVLLHMPLSMPLSVTNTFCLWSK